MGTILRFAIPGLLGLAVCSGLVGGCNAGKIIENKTRPLNEGMNPNPPVDRFGR